MQTITTEAATSLNGLMSSMTLFDNHSNRLTFKIKEDQ